MKSRSWLVILCAFSILLIGSQISAQAPTVNYPFPQHVDYAPDTIRPNHRTQTQLDDDVRAFYEHWKDQYLIDAGTTIDESQLYRVSFGSTNPDQTVSEGQGYGMVIVAYMAGYEPKAQLIFDGLWEFVKAHPSNIDPRLMSWRVTDTSTGQSSAFDGDADIAYALLLADRQWGSDGRINYHEEAEQVITGILESTIGDISQYPMLGDWVNPNGEPYNQYTFRPSDYMPAHFRAFGVATHDERWDAVIENTQTAITSLQSVYSPITGLLPDFSTPIDDIHYNPQPAPPKFLEGDNDGSYSYNAGRVPWRIGTDALLHNDPISISQVQLISRWIESATNGDPTQIKAGYTLSGDPIGDYFTTFFVAPMGVAAMTVPEQQTWLNAIYDAVYAKHENYYEDSVTMLSLLVMTGNYWSPEDIPKS